MQNTLIEKYNLNGNGDNGSEDELELDRRPDEYVAFRVDPQVRPSHALIDFWLSDGDQRAFSYSHLYDVEFKRSDGLVITFSDHQIEIEGRILEKLYSSLKRHRTIFIWEASSQDSLLSDEELPVVTKIDIRIRS